MITYHMRDTTFFNASQNFDDVVMLLFDIAPDVSQSLLLRLPPHVKTTTETCTHNKTKNAWTNG